jgi:hypothetical protein
MADIGHRSDELDKAQDRAERKERTAEEGQRGPGGRERRTIIEGGADEGTDAERAGAGSRRARNRGN